MSYAIELKNRVFCSKFVKGLCSKVYGKQISKDTWRNWREWADVPKRNRSYSFDQLCKLYAIADIRLEHPLIELNYNKEILPLSQSLDVHETIFAIVSITDSRGVVIGREAALALSKFHDIEVSTRTLYRNVPGFSINRIYQIEVLKEWAIA